MGSGFSWFSDSIAMRWLSLVDLSMRINPRGVIDAMIDNRAGSVTAYLLFTQALPSSNMQ